MQREHRVKQPAERIDVAARVDIRPALRLFRRHVLRSADDHAGDGESLAGINRNRVQFWGGIAILPLGRSGEPPIHHENFAEFTDHDVVRLQIAVHDAPGVRKCHRIANLAEDFQQTLSRTASGAVAQLF